MNWRRGFIRVWIVLSALWVGVAYLHVDPGHDLYQEAIVDLPEGPGLSVPLNISSDGIHKALTNYYAGTMATQGNVETKNRKERSGRLGRNRQPHAKKQR